MLQAKTLMRQTALVCAGALLLAACGGGGSSSKPNAPRIPVPGPNFCTDLTIPFTLAENGVTPADGDTDVAVNRAVVVRFTHAVDAASLTDRLTLNRAGQRVASDLTVQGRNVTLRPRQALQPETRYQIRVEGGIQAAECVNATPRSLDSDAVTSHHFITAADAGNGGGTPVDTTAPQLTGIVPADGATLVRQDAAVALSFSEPILPGSIHEGTFQVLAPGQDTPLSGRYDVQGNEVSFRPDTPFALQTDYRIQVHLSGIQDLAGNAAANDADLPLPSRFRSGGVVMALNDTLISQIPGLNDLLNGPVADLLDRLLDLDSDELAGLDKLLILKLPLPTDGLNAEDAQNVLIATCDPASAARNCLLELNLGLDPSALQALTDAFTGEGGPEAALEALAAALLGSSSGNGLLNVDLTLLQEGWTGLLPDQLQALVDPLLAQIADALEPVPLLRDLSLDGLDQLLELKLLQGSLLDLSVGSLLELNLLDLEQGSLVVIDNPDGILDPLLNLLDGLLCPIRILCSR